MKRNKAGIIATIIITVALLAILSIISWVVPIPKQDPATFVVAYVCAMVMIAIEGVLVIVGLFTEKEPNKKILGLPILHFGLVAVIVQLVATTLFYVVNAFVVVPSWIVVIIECLIFLISLIYIVLGFFIKARTSEFKNNQPATSFVNGLRAKIQIVVTNNSNKELERPLQDLYETARGTDPVSSPMTQEVEGRLLAKVDELSEKVNAKASAAEINELIDETKKLIKERAILCKASK